MISVSSSHVFASRDDVTKAPSLFQGLQLHLLPAPPNLHYGQSFEASVFQKLDLNDRLVTPILFHSAPVPLYQALTSQCVAVAVIVLVCFKTVHS